MNDLVTIVILTYNSEVFIEETLNSAKLQTYKNIDLIVSDDASIDNTVDICQKWMSKNKDHFTDMRLITVPKNTGIPANYNRGVLAAKSDWVKFISGDDALLPNCISDNVAYILKHPLVKVLYSYNRVYLNEFKEENYLELNPKCSPLNIINDKISAQEQYKLLLISDRIAFTPSRFLSKRALLDVGLPDEDLYSEDYQMKLGFTRKGYKLYFMESETTLYRQHDMAANNTVKEYILKPHHFKTESFRVKCIYPNIPLDFRLSQKYSWIVNQIFKINYFNTKNKRNYLIYYLLNNVLNPFKYIIYFKSHFLSSYKNNIFYK